MNLGELKGLVIRGANSAEATNKNLFSTIYF